MPNPSAFPATALSQPQLWLIGGTAESVVIAQALRDRSLPFWVTVTTATAQALYPPDTQIGVGALPRAAMAAFMAQHQICAVIDASHPFATEVSKGAIAAAAQRPCPYLRFERPALAIAPLGENSLEVNSKASAAVADSSRWVESVARLEDVLTADLIAGQRLLLIVGYRWLPQFRSWQDQATLFARILPSPTALAVALESGFAPERLIALRPPLSLALETALWQQWGITRVVAKASGSAGGEAVKRQVAAALEIPLTLIQRPSVPYPQQTDCLEAVLAFATHSLATHSLATHSLATHSLATHSLQ